TLSRLSGGLVAAESRTPLLSDWAPTSFRCCTRFGSGTIATHPQPRAARYRQAVRYTVGFGGGLPWTRREASCRSRVYSAMHWPVSVQNISVFETYSLHPQQNDSPPYRNGLTR